LQFLHENAYGSRIVQSPCPGPAIRLLGSLILGRRRLGAHPLGCLAVDSLDDARLGAASPAANNFLVDERYVTAASALEDAMFRHALLRAAAFSIAGYAFIVI
jgi:hypothetical protein